jgi:SAM-dependent methyltransferase
MTGVDPEVIAFYERGDEAGRLESLGRLEFARMMELLERFLPPVPAVVFDVGGGAGAYALALARRGYEVHLLDPIALHLEQALAAVEADAAAELASAPDRRRPPTEVLMRAIQRVEAEPSLLGASPHVMALATRP